MKRCFSMMAICAGALLVSPIHAQQAPVTMSAAVKQQYEGIKRNILAAADKMPEDGYGFQPVKEERNFGAWVAHVADAQTGICSGIAGAPKKINAGSMTSKADLVAALKQSFQTCDAVYDGLTDANATDSVPFFRGQQPRLTALYGNIAHDNECYGSMAVYLRLKGVVPPSSEPKK
jgi:uncharacterized damage-inducible protein DinB